MNDVQLIGGKVLTAQDLEAMNEAEVKNRKLHIPPKDDICPACKAPIIREVSNMNRWACSDPKCKLAHGPHLPSLNQKQNVLTAI